MIGILGKGSDVADLLTEYPTLSRDDALAALTYAVRAVNERESPLQLSA